MAAPSALNSPSSLSLLSSPRSSSSLLSPTNKLTFPLLTKTPISFLSLSLSATQKTKSSSSNDIFVMDAKAKKETGYGSVGKKDKTRDVFEERVVHIRSIFKVVKRRKHLRYFIAVVVVGDKKGQVGVGVGEAREDTAAVQKSASNARRNIVRVPMTKYLTFPHRSDGYSGAAKVVLKPAIPGTGIHASGPVKIVLEMAGVENAFGKQLRRGNPLNIARATVVAIQNMNQFREVAEECTIPIEDLWK